MAHMVPDPIRPDTKSRAERKLYAAFQEQLPDDYVVFHSVSWQARDTAEGVRDGETDFCIAHPDGGILLVEVKGGRIRYDGATGQWFSNRYRIKDPFEQGHTAKYSLLYKLKETAYWRDRWLVVEHAVAFPDVPVKGALRLDAPRELILDAGDVADLRSWVCRAMRYVQGDHPHDRVLGSTGVAHLIDLLSPSWELRSLLATEIEAEQRELVRLTEEQFMMLDFLGRQRRAAICGCAGSGKTTLAVEKGRRLAAQGFRVLLTCFNVNLARFLAADKSLPQRLQVTHFHHLADELVKRAGLLPGPYTSEYFDEILPEQMVEALDVLGPQFDAIIVDEGQDFRDNWWVPLQCLLQDPDRGIFYVFFDDNQNLYQSAQLIPFELAPFSLTRNCRNTRRIHETVMQFYRSDMMPDAQGPLGRPVQVHSYLSALGLKQALSKVLHQLVAVEGVPSQELVVLTPRAQERSQLWRLGTLANCRLVDRQAVASGEVFCTTVHSFKGLESPVVILAEIDAFASRDLETVLYVGCSRACNHLLILTSDNLAQDVRAKLQAGWSK